MISAKLKNILMGGWNYKGKREAEWSNPLSIFWLKNHNYLNKEYSFQSGGINWTYGQSKNSIIFSVIKDNWDTTSEKAYINLKYSYTNHYTGEKESMNNKIDLVTTFCRYGGKRYWFICPLIKNGNYCGRRVGVLFSIDKWFGCRHCGNITYSKQNLSSRYNGFVSLVDIDKAEKEIKRYFYRGKPTRQYRRVIKLNEKFESGLLGMMYRLNKK